MASGGEREREREGERGRERESLFTCIVHLSLNTHRISKRKVFQGLRGSQIDFPPSKFFTTTKWQTILI